MLKSKPIIALLLTTSSLVYSNEISEDQQKWIPKYAKQTKKIAPEDALINTDDEPELTKGFTNLYNGSNLDGWIARGGKCKFEAAGEFIRGTCIPGEPSTFLSTVREDYTDFIFTAEIKWEVDGNTGVMFRSQRKPTQKGELVYGLQCEMEGFSKNRGWSGAIYGQNAGGWRYPLWLEAHKEVRETLKKDDWNRVTIKTVGKEVKTWVNGLPAANWIDNEYEQGFFGLQIHFGKKGTVLFKNIKVKELNKKDCPEDCKEKH